MGIAGGFQGRNTKVKVKNGGEDVAWLFLHSLEILLYLRGHSAENLPLREVQDKF